MNFPQVHGARIVPQPDPELAAAEARLAALDADELVPVRPEWIEATVAKVAVATPVARGGRLRRAAAAAVAFFALHGVATAATVTAVSAVAVTAVVLWPERANSIDTMDYGQALQLLAAEGEREDDRIAAIVLVSIRVKWVVESLQKIVTDGSSAVELHADAGAALATLASDLVVQASDEMRECRDPLAGALADLQKVDQDPEGRQLAMARCLEAARAGIQGLRVMPVASETLRLSRDAALKRVSRLLRP